MPNELVVGNARVGSLIDFNEATPHTQVTLELTEHAIVASMAWLDEASPYAGWFLPTDFTDNSGSTRTAIPSRLLFHDSHGSVLLLDCAARAHHSAWRGAGTGRVLARVAVLGVDEDVDFENPDGLASRISGLHEWRGLSSWEPSRASPGITWSTRDAATDEIGMSDGISIALVPTWSSSMSEDRERVTLTDITVLRTTSDAPRAWGEHLDVHHAVRDLLILSRWIGETCVPTEVRRSEHRLRTLDGAEHGPAWHDVVVALQPVTRPSGYRPHLLPFEALGGEGLLRWMTLRKSYSRALDPIISCRQLKMATPHTLLAHAGPGLEALGYLLLLEDGMTERKARASNLEQRVQRVCRDVVAVLDFADDEWAAQWASYYNAIKHANRRLPLETELLNAWREAVLLVRVWVAMRLGVGVDYLAREVQLDPQTNPYISTRRSTAT